MKKISTSLFFTVMWSGVCQAVGWFFGLFGYKRQDSVSKVFWYVFAISASVVTLFLALALVTSFIDLMYDKYYRPHHCDDPNCNQIEFVSHNVYYHNHHDGKGYLFNARTGEKLLRHVAWIAKPDNKDSLVCYSDGEKRGYFNRYTGKVAIAPKYNHAWIFSGGIASVDEDGHIKFINGRGEVVIDPGIIYYPQMEGYIFEGDYCVVGSIADDCYGLMDRTGKMVLPQEYYTITMTSGGYWVITKEGESAVLDKHLKPVLPLMKGSAYVGEGTIDVTMPDHTLRKYDMEGNLINDFYISGLRMLEYEKEEIRYRNNSVNKVDDEITEILEEAYHPKAVAKLRAYVAGDGFEGLMTADGHRVTMPLYSEIEAIGPDLYLCNVSNGDKVVINGKGEIVK